MIYTVTLNTAIDRIVEISGTLTRKFNNKTNRVQFDIGGKATHVSVALSTMKIENTAIGIIGGNNGDLLVKLMENKGVICKFIDQDNSETRESIIIVDESGLGSFMITQKGFPISDKSIGLLMEFLNRNVTSEDIVVFAGSPPPGFSIDTYGDLLKIVKNKKAKLVIDAAGKFLIKALEYKPYLIKPNEFEFQEYIDKTCETIEDYYFELEKCDFQVDIVVISLGKRGAIAKKDNIIIHAIPPKIAEVNETGAGDFFVSGLVAKIYENASFEEMIRYATAVGASKAMQKESSNFSLEDVNWLLKNCIIERKDSNAL